MLLFFTNSLLAGIPDPACLGKAADLIWWYALHALCVSSSCALQEGRYLAGLQTQTNQNLTGYRVFPFTDLQKYNDMNPLLGTCFANTTGLTITPEMMQRVNACTEDRPICCYKADDQVSPVSCQGTLHSILHMQYKPTQLTIHLQHASRGNRVSS